MTRLAFAYARRHGVPTVPNAAPLDRPVDAELPELVDVLVLDEIEGQVLASTFATGRALAERLLPMVSSAVLVSAGGKGAWLARTGMATLHARAADLDPIDSAGAGDALAGAFCGWLTLSGDWEAAHRWGVAAGALACLQPGFESALPSAVRILAMLETGMY